MSRRKEAMAEFTAAAPLRLTGLLAMTTGTSSMMTQAWKELAGSKRRGLFSGKGAGRTAAAAEAETALHRSWPRTELCPAGGRGCQSRRPLILFCFSFVRCIGEDSRGEGMRELSLVEKEGRARKQTKKERDRSLLLLG